MKLWETGKGDKDNSTVDDFLAGNDVECDEILVKYDILGNIAHCKMLNQVGLLTDEEWSKAHTVLSDIYEEDVDIHESEEDVHTKIENMVSERDPVGNKIHTGRSRNDQIVLDTRLFLKDESIEIASKTLEIAEKLAEKSEKHSEMVMPGYTHHQQAMPSTAGLWFASFAESLKDGVLNMEGCYDVIDQNPLGSAASYGTSLPIDRSLTTEYLGFSDVQKNTLYSVSSRGKLESMLIDDLDQILLDINRFATDIVLYSTKEFGFIELDDNVVTGSSIMPQKRNPDVAEILKGRTNRLMGSSTDIKNILSNNISGYNRDSQETKTVLFDYLQEFEQILDVFSILVEAVSFNEEVLREALAEETFSASTANKLVEEGTPFREAYRMVKKGEAELEDEGFLEDQEVEGSPGNLAVDRISSEILALEKKWSERRTGFEDMQSSLLEK